jgi:hypothetical protein
MNFCSISRNSKRVIYGFVFPEDTLTLVLAISWEDKVYFELLKLNLLIYLVRSMMGILTVQLELKLCSSTDFM